MPRGRPSKELTLDRTLNAIVARAANEIAHTVRQNIADEVARLVGSARAGAATPLGRVGRKRRPILCPVCGNPGGGPRWGWFCADHKDLSAAAKQRARAAARQQPAVAAKRRGRKKK